MKNEWHIPAPGYLVKFVQKEFWDGQMNPPYVVNERSLLGKQIFAILIDSRRKAFMPGMDSDDVLKLMLSDTLAKRSPTLVKMSCLVVWLRELFRRSMIHWVRAQMAIGNNRYQSVISFLDYYEINTPELLSSSYQFIKRYQYKPYRINKNTNETQEMAPD